MDVMTFSDEIDLSGVGLSLFRKEPHLAVTISAPPTSDLSILKLSVNADADEGITDSAGTNCYYSYRPVFVSLEQSFWSHLMDTTPEHSSFCSAAIRIITI